MSECTCHKNYTLDTLIPKVGVITKITQETPDVKTFCVTAPGGGKLFEHMLSNVSKFASRLLRIDCACLKVILSSLAFA